MVLLWYDVVRGGVHVGVVWCGVVWCGAVRCGVVLCGALWCSVGRYGVGRHGVLWRGGGVGLHNRTTEWRKHLCRDELNESIACLKSAMLTESALRRTERIAASLVSAASSAPEYMGVVAATCCNLTSLASRSLRLCTLRMARRPSSSGSAMRTCRQSITANAFVLLRGRILQRSGVDCGQCSAVLYDMGHCVCCAEWHMDPTARMVHAWDCEFRGRVQ